MKQITLTIANIDRLYSIQNHLAENKAISTTDKVYLAEFLSQIPSVNTFLMEKVPLNDTFTVKLWNTSKIEVELQKWQRLFDNLPGWDYCPFCFIVDKDNIELLQRNVIMVEWFAPSYAYNSNRIGNDEPYEVHLKDNGTAIFSLPTLRDAEQYPELYNFKGSWKEAYMLLIETLKKGWPMEEFPEELKPLLKK